MKKRLFAIMLALAMLLAAVPALAEEGEGEPNKTEEKKICTTDGCEKEAIGGGNLCATCAAKKAEEAAKKAEEEAAAKKAAEEEALRKAAEEEAAKKAAEEEALRKAAEEEALRKAAEEQKITEEKNAKKSPMLLGEVNPAGTGADGNCHHDHTVAWASTHTGVQGTMVWHAPTEPTCAKEGNMEYYQCNKCEKYFKKDGSNNIDVKDAIVINLSDTVIPKTSEHTLGEKVTGKPATCTEAGIKEHYKCSVCGKSFSDSDGKIEIADTTIPALNHDYGDPTWNWCGVSSATATFRCRREGCNERKTLPATVTTSNEYSNCYVYTRYTARVTGPDGKDYFDSKTTNCRRPDWYYDPCYYNNPCGHWGCGNVCTRYSNSVPCQNYRTTFRVGGYNCLATPKTGDASVIAPAMLALIGAAGAMLGKKRR